jgi:type II secretion system protein I
LIPLIAPRSALHAPRSTRSALRAQFIPRSALGVRGFTLLEVILALAILAGALVVLGELVRNGMRNAQTARDLSLAAVICEGKLGEISAGLVPTQGVRQSAIVEYPGWFLSVDNDGAAGPAQPNQAGLLKLRVTVEQNPAVQRRPVRFTVTQWVRDPAMTGKPTYLPSSAYYDSTGAIVTSSSTQSGTSQGTSR